MFSWGVRDGMIVLRGSSGGGGGVEEGACGG